MSTLPEFTRVTEIVPHEDSIINPTTGMGMGQHDPSVSTQIYPDSRILSRYQQDYLARIGLIQRIIYTLPRAAIREWGTATLDGGDARQIADINKALTNIPVITPKRMMAGGGLKTAFRIGLGLAHKTGNGAIIMEIDDGRPWSAPVDYNRIRKIERLHVTSRWKMVPDWQSIGPEGYTHFRIYEDWLNFNKDERFQIGQLIHRSRIIWIPGIEDDDEETLDSFRTPGTDRSILDLVIEAFLMYYQAIKGADRMLTDFDVIVQKIQGLSEMLAADCDAGTNDAAQMVRQTAQLNNRSRSMYRSYVCDKDEEDIVHTNRSAGGYGDLLGHIQKYFQINTPYPPAVLGIDFSSGLGASGESQEERTLWNDTVSQLQSEKMTPHMKSSASGLRGVLDLIMLSQDGPTNGKLIEEVDWKWHPLYSPTPKEQAELEQSRAQIIVDLSGVDRRFASNAILSHWGGKEFEPTITLTDEYKAALEKEAKLEVEPLRMEKGPGESGGFEEEGFE